MPGLPLTRLILRHSYVALRILERTLDPKALRLHLRKLRRFTGMCQLVRFPVDKFGWQRRLM